MKILKSLLSWKALFHVRLQQKLLISYFLLILMLLGIFMSLSYDRVYQAVESILRYSAQQSFEQSGSFLSKKIDYAVNVSDAIFMSKSVSAFPSHSVDSIDVFSQMGDYIDLSNLLNSYNYFNDIYKIRLYVNDDLLFANSDSFLSLSKAKKESWFAQLKNSENNNLWVYFLNDETTMAEEPTIALVRLISDQNDLAKQIAILREDILESEVRKILKKSSPTRSSVSYILNAENAIYSSSQNINIQNGIPKYKNLTDLMETGETFFGTYKIQGKKVLLGCQRISNSGLLQVTIIPYNEILDASRKIRNEMFILLLLVLAAAYVFAYIISTSIVKRIKLLIKYMHKIQEGEFGAELTVTSQDEIGELMCNFNYMSEQLSHMIKEQFRIGQEAKSYELKALQGQINPHFLYNTLDLINWTAINHRVPEISSMVKALSKFYKLSLSKGSDIITIKDELEHVRLFMEIQNKRFDNAFHFFIDADERVYSYTTLKIILQPIVENSILHGILKKDSKAGTITIQVALEGSNVIFTIDDDGYGMSETELKGVLLTSTNMAHGYGVRNINDRIQLYYGKEYGLSYSSVVNKGTSVRITIPAVTEEGTMHTNQEIK